MKIVLLFLSTLPFQLSAQTCGDYFKSYKTQGFHISFVSLAKKNPLSSSYFVNLKTQKPLIVYAVPRLSPGDLGFSDLQKAELEMLMQGIKDNNYELFRLFREEDHPYLFSQLSKNALQVIATSEKQFLDLEKSKKRIYKNRNEKIKKDFIDNGFAAAFGSHLFAYVLLGYFDPQTKMIISTVVGGFFIVVAVIFCYSLRRSLKNTLDERNQKLTALNEVFLKNQSDIMENIFSVSSAPAVIFMSQDLLKEFLQKLREAGFERIQEEIP